MLNLDFRFSSGGSLAYIGRTSISQFPLGAHLVLLALLVKCVAAAIINLFQKFPNTLGTICLLHNVSEGGILTQREKQHCQGWEGMREEIMENSKIRKKDQKGKKTNVGKTELPKPR